MNDLSPLDAMRAAPDQHEVLLENQHVRVLDTNLAPGECSSIHEHAWPAALYVLSWSDFIRYSPEDEVLLDSRTFPAPPAPGQAIWSGPLPPHYLRNVGDSDLRLIAVEIKPT